MKRLLYLFMLLALCSCREHVKHRTCSFSLQEKAKVSDIVKNYSIVRLETTDDNLIVDPSVVRLSDGKIFILDRFSPSKSLYVFQSDGKYVGKVGNKGEGPGEYVMPHSFVINEKYHRVFLRDMATNKILAYNLSDFAFIEEYSLPFYATCFDLLDDDHFIWYVNSGLQNEGDFCKHIQVTDLRCRPVRSDVASMLFPERGMYNVQSYFFRSSGETYFHHPFLGEYYRCQLQDSVLHSAFSLHFDHLSFPSRTYVEGHKDNIVKDTESDHLIQWCDVLKSSSCYVCFFGTGKEKYWGVFDDRKGTGWYIDAGHLEDDLGIGNLARPKAVYQDYFVSFVSMEGDLPSGSVLTPYKEYRDGNPLMLLYKPGN